MNLIRKLFSKKQTQNINKKKSVDIEEKLQNKVYPRIKNINSINSEFIYHEYLGGDLVLIFIQDINDEMHYVLKTEEVKLKNNIQNWKNNIKEISFNLFTTDSWNGDVFFNESNDYSNEKIFDPLFIEKACQKLNTDKIIISISRRYKMQVTDFYDEFKKLELFFYNHFSIWRDQKDGDEVITESVLIAEKGKGVTSIVNMGFRMNLYGKNGKTKLSYSTFEDFEDLNFSKIIEKRKEPFQLIER